MWDNDDGNSAKSYSQSKRTNKTVEIRFTNAQQKEMILHGLSTIVHQNTMPKNEGIDNDYDYLLNTMVNMGGDIDTPPTDASARSKLQTTLISNVESNTTLCISIISTRLTSSPVTCIHLLCQPASLTAADQYESTVNQDRADHIRFHIQVEANKQPTTSRRGPDEWSVPATRESSNRCSPLVCL
jgi:hypothetical protein